MADYFVKTTGNDGNDGSFDTPWKTIQYGVSQSSSGDTLWVESGNYTLGDTLTIASGIIIRGYGETLPVYTTNFTNQLEKITNNGIIYNLHIKLKSTYTVPLIYNGIFYNCIIELSTSTAVGIQAFYNATLINCIVAIYKTQRTASTINYTLSDFKNCIFYNYTTISISYGSNNGSCYNLLTSQYVTNPTGSETFPVADIIENQDPLFNLDYTLQEGSPAISAGINESQYNNTDGTRNDLGIWGGPYILLDEPIGYNRPTSGNNIITKYRNINYTFSTEDIPFNDNDGDTLGGLIIESIPIFGTLTNNGISVKVDDIINDVTLLKYSKESNNYSDYFKFKVFDNIGLESVSSYTITILEARMYCNTDLKRYYTNIDEFDLKKTLMDEWTHLTDGFYKYYDSGNVVKLYQDGVDLGDPQATEAAVTDGDVGDWYYDADGDYIYIKCSGDVCNSEMQVAPMDWPSAKVAAIADGAEWLEGLLDVRFPRPLPKNADGNYDYIIERINGLLACIILIRTSNPEASEIDAIWRELYNDTETGLLQLLNIGKIKLGFEVTQSDKGAIEVGALDATTTGELTDPQGTATLDYEKFKVEIVTGGTLITGTKNETVTYKVTDSQGSEVNSVDYITGYYQPIGGGIEARFTSGIYVANDYWYVTVTAVPSSTQTVRTIRVSR